MAQQTAVDWLVEMITDMIHESHHSEFADLYESAKQMEEQQHSKTFEAGNKRGWSGYPDTDNWTQPTFQQYYKETYSK